MSDIMWDGVNLMVMGMGSVFVFLALLVLGIVLMSRILMHFPAEVEVAARPQNRTSDEEMAEVAAVAAAIKLVHLR